MFTQNEINRLPRILQSVCNGDLEAVNEYISQGGDLGVSNFCEWVFLNLLTTAAITGHLSIVDRLLDAGFDPQTKDNYAIRYAAYNGHLDVVNRLIEVGCDPQANDNLAIRLAADYGHRNIVYVLYDTALEKGIPIPRNITPVVKRILNARTERLKALPMIFSTIANNSGFADPLINNIDRIMEYDGCLNVKNIGDFCNFTRKVYNDKYNSEKNNEHPTEPQLSLQKAKRLKTGD